MSDLYRDIILDHYHNPQFQGELSRPDFYSREANPLCGDVLAYQLRLDDEGRVAEVAWQGEGCAISVAAADMVAEHIRGQTLVQIGALTADDVLALLGVELGPTRLKCALLSLSCLHSELRRRGAI